MAALKQKHPLGWGPMVGAREEAVEIPAPLVGQLWAQAEPAASTVESTGRCHLASSFGLLRRERGKVCTGAAAQGPPRA